MIRFLLSLTICLSLAGCGFLKMPESDGGLNVPPPEPADAAEGGKVYLRAVADAFETHAKNLRGTVPESDSLKQMRKTLTAAPEAAFLPAMRQLNSVPPGDDQRTKRAEISENFAKQLRGVK